MRTASMIRPLIVFTVLLAASGVIARAERTERVPPRQTFDTFPMTVAEWRGRPDRPLTAEERAVLGADDYLTRSYFSPGRGVGLYVGYWSTQKRGDAVHSPLNCLPGSGWEPTSHRYLPLQVTDAAGAASEIQVNRYIIQKGLERVLVLYWYQSHGRVIASEYWGKYYLVADAVRMGRSDTALVRVTATITDSGRDAELKAERSATAFVQTLFPALGDYIPS
jgi:EpsI family protein